MTENKIQEPYEMNTTWWSAINGDLSEEDMPLKVKRYVASRSVALVLQGVPAIYAHGVIGSSNDHELVKRTGVKRDVNRAVIRAEALAKEIRNPDSKISAIYRQWPRLNLTRTSQRAFHPHGDQRVLILSPCLFSVLRTSPEGDQYVLAMTNVTGRVVQVEISPSEIGIDKRFWYDLINERELSSENDRLSIPFQPYDVIWLKPGIS
jgi:sucrose phosphorylase